MLSEPFNINLLSSFNHSELLKLLEFFKPPSEPPSEPSSALPFVLPVEPPSEPSFELILDDNFTDIEDIDNSLSLESSFNDNTYQYNLVKGDCFDDWSLVDTFMHQYCLERGFGYQIFRNDKDSSDPTIIRQ